jgi:hypothetical protein
VCESNNQKFIANVFIRLTASARKNANSIENRGREWEKFSFILIIKS